MMAGQIFKGHSVTLLSPTHLWEIMGVGEENMGEGGEAWEWGRVSPLQGVGCVIGCGYRTRTATSVAVCVKVHVYGK